MGLPVITLQGKSFASRVASSILSSINMPELITTKINDYENPPELKIEFVPKTARGIQKILVTAPNLERVVGFEIERSGIIPTHKRAIAAGVRTFNGSMLFVKIGQRHQKAAKNNVKPENKESRSILFWILNSSFSIISETELCILSPLLNFI